MVVRQAAFLIITGIIDLEVLAVVLIQPDLRADPYKAFLILQYAGDHGKRQAILYRNIPEIDFIAVLRFAGEGRQKQQNVYCMPKPHSAKRMFVLT